MKVITVIPARFASTRFPGKPLVKLAGKTIIQHVYDNMKSASFLDDVIVATDDQRIYDEVVNFGGKVRMTSSEHKSGSDRVAEVARKIEADVIVNVQGDEPFLKPELLEELVKSFADPEVAVASMMHKVKTGFTNPNNVKVVCDANDFALYFSRAPIPYPRDTNLKDETPFFKHIGIYAYRKDALLKFVELPVSQLESLEKLEQLRLLENGFRIKMIPTKYSGVGIDTPEDLAEAEKMI